MAGPRTLAGNLLSAGSGRSVDLHGIPHALANPLCAVSALNRIEKAALDAPKPPARGAAVISTSMNCCALPKAPCAGSRRSRAGGVREVRAQSPLRGEPPPPAACALAPRSPRPPAGGAAESVEKSSSPAHLKPTCVGGGHRALGAGDATGPKAHLRGGAAQSGLDPTNGAGTALY